MSADDRIKALVSSRMALSLTSVSGPQRRPASGRREHGVSVRVRPSGLTDDITVRVRPLPAFLGSTVGEAPGHRAATSARRLGETTAVSTLAPAEVELERPVEDEERLQDLPWIVIVWNDPINLMSYVTLVFQKLFGYSRQKATELMLQVHREGKAVVSSGPREKIEHDVSRLHSYGLWATMRQD